MVCIVIRLPVFPIFQTVDNTKENCVTIHRARTTHNSSHYLNSIVGVKHFCRLSCDKHFPFGNGKSRIFVSILFLLFIYSYRQCDKRFFQKATDFDTDHFLPS